VGLKAGLDRCGKSRPHRDPIPGRSSPQAVAIPTELPGTFVIYGNSTNISPIMIINRIYETQNLLSL
jgi:hypothetical protein